MGLYQLVLPVYSLILLGLTAVVLPYQDLSQKKRQGELQNAKRIAVISGVSIFIAGTQLFSYTLNLDFIVNILVGDKEQKRTVLFAAFNSPYCCSYIFKGIFHGSRRQYRMQYPRLLSRL